MILAKIIDPIEKQFEEIDLSIFERPELGELNFKSILPEFEHIYSSIHEMVRVCQRVPEIPQALKDNVVLQMKWICAQYNNFKAFDLSKPSHRPPQDTHNQLTSNFRGSLSRIYSNKSEKNEPQNFVATYSYFKTWDTQLATGELTHAIDLKNEAIDAKAEFTKIKNDYDEALKALREQVSEEITFDYANIFAVRSKANRKASGIWFISATVLSLVFIFSVFYIMTTKYSFLNLLSINIIMIIAGRIALLSFCLFLISFCFKQYSIQRHQFSLNVHRQNTLNSFKLFIETIDKEDTTTRHALMMEVAKAIYESGSTGYLSGKMQAEPPSIIEMTRFMGKN